MTKWQIDQNFVELKKNFENTKVKAELTFVIALGGGRLGYFLLLDRQVPPQPGGLL